MTVGPQKVQLSEFEYLYKKNNDQQASKTSLDDYIEMFVNYKLKVQAAKDAGLDTTASYVSDMEKYTAELAAPYMRSAIVDDSLVNVAYEHMQEMVLVDHILLSPLEKTERTPPSGLLPTASVTHCSTEPISRSLPKNILSTA